MDCVVLPLINFITGINDIITEYVLPFAFTNHTKQAISNLTESFLERADDDWELEDPKCVPTHSGFVFLCTSADHTSFYLKASFDPHSPCDLTLPSLWTKKHVVNVRFACQSLDHSSETDAVVILWQHRGSSQVICEVCYWTCAGWKTAKSNVFTDPLHNVYHLASKRRILINLGLGDFREMSYQYDSKKDLIQILEYSVRDTPDADVYHCRRGRNVIEHRSEICFIEPDLQTDYYFTYKMSGQRIAGGKQLASQYGKFKQKDLEFVTLSDTKWDFAMESIVDVRKRKKKSVILWWHPDYSERWTFKINLAGPKQIILGGQREFVIVTKQDEYFLFQPHNRKIKYF